MYKCESCGHLFEEGEQGTFVDTHGFQAPPYEEKSCCPLCKGSYEEIKPCKICGSYEHDVNKEFCIKCEMDVQKRFKRFVDKEFNKEERELLNELYDGEWI